MKVSIGLWKRCAGAWSGVVALLALQEVAVETEAMVIAMEIGVMMLVATHRSQ